MTCTVVGETRPGAPSFWPEPEETNRTIRQWATDCDALAGCGNAVQVLAAIRSQPDEVLIFLITHAQAGNVVADYLLARTMAPKLRQMASRDPDAEFDDYLTQLWMRIHTYPIAHRSHRVAANLALDTLKAVVAQRPPQQELPADEIVEWGCVTVESVRLGRDLLVAAEQIGLIDGTTAGILASVYIDGLSGRQAARRHHTSPEMIRYRCSTYVRRMTRHRQELLAHLVADDRQFWPVAA